MWDIPWDVALFGVVVLAFFCVGLPLITRRVSVPRKIDFKIVSGDELTHEQTRYFVDLDPSLLEMGYRPVGNRRTLNMQGRALIRTYMSDADPAIIMMNLMTAGAAGAGEHPMNYLEIITRYADGTILSTRNAEISDVLEALPTHIIQEQKGVRDPAKLKLAHDERARSLLIHGPVFSRPDEFEQAFDDFHERWCLHQIDRGLLVPRSDDAQQLRPTVKAGLRGIANFLNPVADNFTLPRFLLAVILGLVVPVAALLWLGGSGSWLVTRVAAESGLSPHSLSDGVSGVDSDRRRGPGRPSLSGEGFIWSFLDDAAAGLHRAGGPPWAAVALSGTGIGCQLDAAASGNAAKS